MNQISPRFKEVLSIEAEKHELVYERNKKERRKMQKERRLGLRGKRTMTCYPKERPPIDTSRFSRNGHNVKFRSPQKQLQFLMPKRPKLQKRPTNDL